METPVTILQQYWKYSQFRPLQEEIINSLLQGQDTLALLPTGGGKSVCFQVPALMLEGITIVITPLIALMNDQVEQLRNRQIEAVAIHAALSRREIDIYLDNCIYGKIKFLYVSPERLLTELFRERFKQMNVALIAVDEAHCISQWGYDFRPPYLQIASLRELKPGVPVIALTATATEDVQEDIAEKLLFKIPYGKFSRSFARENLSFNVRKAESKDRKLLEILQKVKGSAIIYVRSRKATQEIAEMLNRRGIRASFYHAGLQMEERERIQQQWIGNKSRVMVATNAFGMGIDKPDVRLVIHVDLPENIESYYQEAGRAGRDGEHAYAVIIYHDGDITALRKKVEQAHPSIDYLKRVYQALANNYQLAVGSGGGISYDFDLAVFADRFNLHAAEVYPALRKLEEEGLVQFNESYYSPSQLFIAVDTIRLYEFQIANAGFDPLIKMLLRLYGGELYSGFMKISEAYLAKALNANIQDVVKALNHLDELQIVIYKPMKDAAQLTFVLPRQDAANLPLDRERMEARKKLVFSKMEAMIELTINTGRCRMQLIQEYFGETDAAECNMCDVCLSKKKTENRKEEEELKREVVVLLADAAMSLEDLEEKIAPEDHELFVDVIREMVEAGELEYDETWRLQRAKR